MKPSFSVRKKTKSGSIKFMTITACIAICLTAWLAAARLQASDNMDDPDENFQNAAQAQHAYNLAIQATLQDPKVAKAIECAKRTGKPRDIRRAKRLFRAKKADYIEKISDMRSSRMGWGNIARELDVHPSFLGLGHSKFRAKYDWDFSKHSRIRSEIKAATARNFKGKAKSGHAAGGSASTHKSLTYSRTKDRKSSNSRGLALGHNKGKGDTVTAGYTAGHGNARGNGRGNGHANGNANGHGNGHGGGNGGGNGRGPK